MKDDTGDVTIDMPVVYRKLKTIFENGKRERFEDGFYSEFSWNLVHLLNSIDYHYTVLDLLIHMILVWEWESYEVAGEACRWIGHADHGEYCGNPSILEHIESRTRRRKMLEYILLNAKGSALKDDACLGIASIDDPASIPAVTLAIKREQYETLKENFQQVLDQLIVTDREKHLSYKDYLGE